MGEFGHETIRGPGFFADSWGAGPFVITVAGKRYLFEDSDRFGPSFLNPKTGDPTNEMIPQRSPFWKGYERWKAEGRKVIDGKPLGKGEYKLKVKYCVLSDLRSDSTVYFD